MKVFVECFHDKAVVRSVAVKRQDMRHEHSIGNVMNRLRRMSGEVIGLIDEDPGSGGRPVELQNYEVRQESHQLRLLCHRTDPSKRVIVFCPRLEEWLIARAKVCGVKTGDYGLPDTGRALHHDPRYDLKPGFHLFLRDLLVKDAGLRQLKTWLGG